jgi:hypothetical protein
MTPEQVKEVRKNLPEGMRLCAHRNGNTKAHYCHQVKPVGEFVPKNGKPTNMCFECRALMSAEYRAARDPEVIRAQSRAWDQANVERRRARQRTPRRQQLQRENHRRRMQEDPEYRERQQEKARNYHQANIERRREQDRLRKQRYRREKERARQKAEYKRQQRQLALEVREAKRDELEARRISLGFRQQKSASAYEWEIRELYAPLPAGAIRPLIQAAIKRIEVLSVWGKGKQYLAQEVADRTGETLETIERQINRVINEYRDTQGVDQSFVDMVSLTQDWTLQDAIDRSHEWAVLTENPWPFGVSLSREAQQLIKEHDRDQRCAAS